MFSGSRGLASALSRSEPWWILCWDIEHHAREDLLNCSVRRQIELLIVSGAFLGLSGGPVCASFSTAIVPPWRTAEHPLGVPWATPAQKKKLRAGNSFLRWTVKLVRLAEDCGLLYLFENPQNSHFWKQAAWHLGFRRRQWIDCLLDFCVFGMPWRKSTRFRTNSLVSGVRLRCRCSKPHIVLRGRCKAAKANWTKLVEAYPPDLCKHLAENLSLEVRKPLRQAKLDVAACSRSCSLRPGEASVPGPRTARAALRRTPGALRGVELLEPATVALRVRFWDAFLELKVPFELRLTPALMRGGGAVASFRSGEAIQSLQWRMRLQHQHTLAFYLQEVIAISILPSLDSEARSNIQAAAACAQHVCSEFSSRSALRATSRPPAVVELQMPERQALQGNQLLSRRR